MENLIHTARELLRTAKPVSCGALWRTRRLAGAAFLILWTFLGPKLLHAQAAASPQTAQSTQAKPAAQAKPTTHTASAHRRARVRRAAVHATKPAAAVPAAPPAPPKPNWPAQQPPNPAKVTWDSQGLAIEASNSSLDQILHEVATETGTRLQGLNQDERIFGSYGPGPAREVLSRLLEGSGYNMVMIGGQGDEPPQQLILSKSAAGNPQPVNVQNKNNQDEESEADEQSPQPPDNPPMPMRSPFGAGGPPNRTPQEIQQEMLMRQQQIEQQQQQQQNNPQ
jgi:hypothetical protein